MIYNREKRNGGHLDLVLQKISTMRKRKESCPELDLVLVRPYSTAVACPSRLVL